MEDRGGQRGVGELPAWSSPGEMGDQVAGAVEVLEVEGVDRAGADQEDGLPLGPGDHVLRHRRSVAERRGVDPGRPGGLVDGHGAVGGRVDERPAPERLAQQRERGGMGEAGQRLGAVLPGQDEGAGRSRRRHGAGRVAVERRDHLGGPVGQGRGDAAGGEEHVEDDHHLAGQSLPVELLLLREDVQLHPRSWMRCRSRARVACVPRTRTMWMSGAKRGSLVWPSL